MPHNHHYCTDWQPIFATSTPDLNRQSSIPINPGVFLSIYAINVAFAEPYIGNKYWDQPVPRTASQVDPQKPMTSTSTTSTSEVGIDAVCPKEMKNIVVVSTTSQKRSLDIPEDGIRANKKQCTGDVQFNLFSRGISLISTSSSPPTTYTYHCGLFVFMQNKTAQPP